MFDDKASSSKSVSIKQDPQCAGTAVAGNDATGSGDINVIKMAQAFQVLVHFLDHFFFTAGVGDEYAVRICV